MLDDTNMCISESHHRISESKEHSNVESAIPDADGTFEVWLLIEPDLLLKNPSSKTAPGQTIKKLQQKKFKIEKWFMICIEIER